MSGTLRHGKATDLSRCRRGTAAVEFALVFPLLLLLLLGAFDSARILVDWGRVYAAADAVGEIATEIALDPKTGLGTMDPTRANQAMSAIYAYLPGTLASDAYSVTLTEVRTSQVDPACTSGCAWADSVAWSLGKASGTAVTRPCGTLTQVPDGTPPSPGTIPASVVGERSVVVVDVSYTYTPVFLTFVTGAVTLRHTSYAAARTPGAGQYIPVSVPNNGPGACPGAN